MVAALARADDPVSPGRWDGQMDASSTTLLPCQTSGGQPPVVQKSVFVDGRKEAEKFKWIVSEKAGFDLGEQAIHQWVSDHWSNYLRARWLEHLHGTYFWTELDKGDFGLIQRAFQDCKPLLQQILDRLKDGKENLDIVRWALEHAPNSVERVISILEELDINSRRLECQFYRGKSASSKS
jgi:hypothetical protein